MKIGHRYKLHIIIHYTHQKYTKTKKLVQIKNNLNKM